MILRYFRRFFYEIHLWLGIVSGIILFIVCLSGAIYVFREEAQYIAEPKRYIVEVPQDTAMLSADELIAKVEAAKPGMKVGSITIPEQPNRTVSMNMTSLDQGGERGGPRGGGMERGARGGRGEGRGGRGPRAESERSERNQLAGTPASTKTVAVGQSDGTGRPRGGPPQGGRSGGGGHGRGRNAVYVNPYTGDIVAEGANKVDPFFMSMMQLHRWLWFSGEWRQTGKMIVGWATIIFVVICLSGFILWLPKTWNGFKRWDIWKTGLRVRFRKGIWPFLYDTHNTIGFYLLIPALVLALTGLCWSFRWYNQGLGNLLGLDGPALQRGGGVTATFVPPEDAKSLSVGRMIELQNELTPGPGEIVVSIPQIENVSQRDEGVDEGRDMQAMSIQKGRTGFFSLTFKDRTQWDYYRGEVIPVESYGKTVEVERFTDRPLKNQIAGSIRAIHFGNITGLSSKIFFFIVCLFATSWPLTGVLLWIKKLRAKHKKRKAAREATEQSGTVQASSHQQPVDETTTNVGQTV